MRLVIDLRDVRDGGARAPEQVIGALRRFLADDGYAASFAVEQTPGERERPVSEERKRELMGMSPMGAELLKATRRIVIASRPTKRIAWRLADRVLNISRWEGACPSARRARTR